MNCTKYELCEIVAIDQLEGAAAAAGEKTVSINPALMNVGTEETPVDATHIVLKSGDDAEGSTASQLLITVGEVQAETYTITINADGGTGENVPVTGTFEEGAEIVLPVLTKDGYTFLGWKKDDAETVIAGSDAAATTVYATADATYTAQWEEVAPVTYTITINADGGTGTEVPTTGEFEAGAEIVLPVLTKEGYTFLGWKKDDATEVITGSDAAATTVTVDAVATYTAVFEEVAGGGEEPTYTTHILNSVYGQTGARVIRYFGIDAGKVVTVDGVHAKYYTDLDTQKTVYIVAIPASDAEPVVSIVDETDDLKSEAMLFGNINGDTKIGLADAIMMKRTQAGYTPAGGEKFTYPTDIATCLYWDINGDGKVGLADAIMMKRTQAGYTPAGGEKFTYQNLAAYNKK